MTKHRSILVTWPVWVGFVVLFLSYADLLAAEKPNVLLIMTDDQGFGDINSHGNPLIKNPVMDSLAADGARFNRFYVYPVCAPTRAGLLTGRYNLRCGVWGVTHGKESMVAEEVTVAEAFQAAGYQTALIGKWHLGEHYPRVPHGQGFDQFIGFRLGHWNNYFDTILERNGKPLQTEGYITEFLTDKAIEFIDQAGDQPFFCYLPYNAPHSPWQVPDKYYRIYEDLGVPETARTAYAMVSCVDDNIGRVLDHLEKNGKSENTIVIFLTDNGPNGDRYNAGMKGRKGSVHEGGVRVPFFVRWPAKIKKGQSIETTAAHIDVFPTLVEMCGIEMPNTSPLDGKSLWPLMQSEAVDWPDRMLYFNQVRRSMKTKYPGAIRTQQFRWVNEGKRDELYDMVKDPGEQNNLADQFPELTREFSQAYDRWYDDVTTERGLKRLPIPVGYEEENPLILPATQANLDGKVRFEGRAGWANDWLTGWIAGGQVTWNVDVVAAGTYEMVLHYRCDPVNVGTAFTLDVGGKTLSGRLKVPENTPPVPHPDRVPRKEVYEVKWATAKLGGMKLEKGAKSFALTAVPKSPDAMLAVKSIQLRKQQTE